MKRFLSYILWLALFAAVPLALAADTKQTPPTQTKIQDAKPEEPPPFDLPRGVEKLASDNSGKTWRMNGRLKGELAANKKQLYLGLLKAKFDFKHETPLDVQKTHLLSTWVKGREVLLLMVWQGEGFTYFSWGTYTE